MFLLLAALGASAQDVYVTSPNNKIIKVDFDSGATKTVVDDPGTRFHALAVRRAGDLNALRSPRIKTPGGNIRIYDEMSGDGAIRARYRGAHGLALSRDGDIFATNRSFRGNDQVVFIRKKPT